MIALLSEKVATISHCVQRMAVGMELVFDILYAMRGQYLEDYIQFMEGGVTVRKAGNPPIVN